MGGLGYPRKYTSNKVLYRPYVVTTQYFDTH